MEDILSQIPFPIPLSLTILWTILAGGGVDVIFMAWGQSFNSIQLGFAKAGFKGATTWRWENQRVLDIKTKQDPNGLLWEQPCRMRLLSSVCAVCLHPASLNQDFICLSGRNKKNCQGLSESISRVRDSVMQMVRNLSLRAWSCHNQAVESSLSRPAYCLKMSDIMCPFIEPGQGRLIHGLALGKRRPRAGSR